MQILKVVYGGNQIGREGRGRGDCCQGEESKCLGVVIVCGKA